MTKRNMILKAFFEIYRIMCFLKACDDGKCLKIKFLSHFELSRLSRKYLLFSTRFIQTAFLFSFQIYFHIFSEISPSSSRFDCLNQLLISFSAPFFNRVFVLRGQEYFDLIANLYGGERLQQQKRDKRKMRQEKKRKEKRKRGKKKKRINKKKKKRREKREKKRKEKK